MAVPIPLTQEQIKNILKEVPYPPGVGRSALKTAKETLKTQLQTLLKEVKLVPNEEAYREFKEEIIRDIYTSFVQVGENVGTSSATSLAAPMTQMSLNTFHYVGTQSGVATSFQKIRSYLTGSKSNKEPQMSLYFKTDEPSSDLHDVVHTGTYSSILSMRGEFEQTTVRDLTISTEIVPGEKIPGIRDLLEIHASLFPMKFRDLASRFPLTYVMVLKLDKYRMYTHKITMGMVARAIEGPEKCDALICIWKSQFEFGNEPFTILYVLVDELYNFELCKLNVNGVLHFLHLYAKNQLSKWIVSGVKDIYAIEPVRVDVMKGIQEIKKMKDQNYRIYTSHYKTRWTGVSLGDIANLITTLGLEVVKMNKKKLYITVKGDLSDFKTKVKEARDAVENKEASQEFQRIAEASQYYYMLTSGSNMNEVIWRDDVDLYRCTSNDSHEIFEIRGIDATKFYLTMRFQQILEGMDSYVNKCHTAIVFDLLTNLASINSLSFAGLVRRNIPALALASHERAHEVFGNSATFGELEYILGVSEAMYTGGFSKNSGTGSILVEQNYASKKERIIGGFESGMVVENTTEAEELLKEEMKQESRLTMKLPMSEVMKIIKKERKAFPENLLDVLKTPEAFKDIRLKYNTKGREITARAPTVSLATIALPQLPKEIQNLGLPIPPMKGITVPSLPTLIEKQETEKMNPMELLKFFED